MNAANKWHRPNYRPERAASERVWAGYLGCDNFDAIANRVQRICRPGRTLIRTHQDGQRPPEVKAGLTLYDNSEAIGRGFSKWEREYGCGFHVQLGPGLNGFGASAEYGYDVDKDERVPNTGAEIMARAEKGTKGWLSAWSWIEIKGGLANDGWNPSEDLITIVQQNEHGYRETIQIIPGDMAWQQRHERDALAADRLRESIGDPKADLDEYHPSHGLTAEQREHADVALAEVAANLRKWREPILRDEVYPHIDGRWL